MPLPRYATMPAEEYDAILKQITADFIKQNPARMSGEEALWAKIYAKYAQRQDRDERYLEELDNRFDAKRDAEGHR